MTTIGNNSAAATSPTCRLRRYPNRRCLSSIRARGTVNKSKQSAELRVADIKDIKADVRT